MPSMADLLQVVHFVYPVSLLVIFVIAFAAQGILSASPAKASRSNVTGPGGKPLPQNQRSKQQKDRLRQSGFSHNQKLLFCWLSIGHIATFLANAANVIIHALAEVDNGGWWCGEAMVVSFMNSVCIFRH